MKTRFCGLNCVYAAKFGRTTMLFKFLDNFFDSAPVLIPVNIVLSNLKTPRNWF